MVGGLGWTGFGFGWVVLGLVDRALIVVSQA